MINIQREITNNSWMALEIRISEYCIEKLGKILLVLKLEVVKTTNSINYSGLAHICSIHVTLSELQVIWYANLHTNKNMVKYSRNINYSLLSFVYFDISDQLLENNELIMSNHILPFKWTMC